MKIKLDHEKGEEIGICEIERGAQNCQAIVQNVTGRHAIFFIVEVAAEGWALPTFMQKTLFELESFLFPLVDNNHHFHFMRFPVISLAKKTAHGFEKPWAVLFSIVYLPLNALINGGDLDRCNSHLCAVCIKL
jgi:hypothetical protein